MADPVLTWGQKGNLKGPKGDPGDPGVKGETGVSGRSFRTANVDVQSNTDVARTAINPNDNILVGDVIVDAAGDVYTVTALATDTVHVSNAIAGYSLKGPKGDQGEPGADGKGISIAGSVATKNDLPTDLTAADAGKGYLAQDDGLLYIWDGTKWSDGTQFKGDKGDKGDPGDPGVTGVAATPLEAGASPTVNLNKGVLTLGIPAGAAGSKGDPGAAGVRGNTITTAQGAPTNVPDAIAGDLYIDVDTWNVYQYGEQQAA